MRRIKQILPSIILIISLILNLVDPGLGAVLAQDETSSSQPLLAVFSVTNTNDSGAGSLRQAILDANATPGTDTITFAIAPQGSQQTIQPLSALPVLTDPVIIDGWSQGGAGYTSPPLIEINGSQAGSSVAGLAISAGNSTVRGLVINDFLGTNASGIRLQTGGNNWVYGNYIGINFSGDTRAANQRGIWIDSGSSNNRIGTNADGTNDSAERNVISGNINQNIWIYQTSTTGNKIMGNFIGLNASGEAAIGSTMQTIATSGVLVQEASFTVIGTDGDGQGDALEGNVISGSVYNVHLTGTNPNPSTNNRISGNRIGTNAAGTEDMGLQVEGVRVYVTSYNLIGTDGDGISDDVEGNLISGNNDFGIMLQQTGALNNIVAGNKIGTDITGMAAIPNGTNGSPRAGISLGGYGNRIGTNNDGVSDELERNLISGNANVAVYAIYFNNLPDPGAPATIIAGNWMGVDATGLAALPNNYGIGGTSNVPVIIRDNVIAAHTYEGIDTHTSNMQIFGNLVGVGADGITPLGNRQNGIFLSGNNNIIGGTGPGETNIIAHNGTLSPNYSGVRIGNTGLRNTIRGNRIYSNSQLGIDLRWPDGVNINDDGDPDTGGNNLQNYPIITFAQAYANGTTVIQGTLNSNPNTTFNLDFYYSSEADPSGHGEGEYYLGEATVTTNGDGDAAFDATLPATIPPNQFVTATATHADGSTSEFSLALAAGGVLDVPVSGLTMQVSPPIYTALPTQFVANVSAGTGVSYEWDFGDGGLGSGAVVEHTYTTPGTYTVTLSASNNSSSANLSEVITALEPANINGVIWADRDADGFFGMGETSLNVVQDTVVAVTLQEPPHTVLTTGLNASGSYQIFTPQAGLYQVEAANSTFCYLANCITTPSPTAVAMAEDGGVEINFGVAVPGFVYQPGDDGYIVGRAWLDTNGNGLPDPNETPLNGRTARLLDANGSEIATHVTGSAWSHGMYGFRISQPGAYRVHMDAPSGVYPASRVVDVYVTDLRMVNAHLPFLPGGTIGGQVSGANGAGLGGAVLILQPGNLQTLTASDGSYSFSGLTDGRYTLQLTPPANYITEDGVTQRFVLAAINSGVVENWTLLRKGDLLIRTNQVVSGQPLPIGFMWFELLLNGANVQTVQTNANGEALIEGLTPGTYTVRPWDIIINNIPGMQFTPAERTVIIGNEISSTASFTGTLTRSVNIYCRLPVTGQPGFACNYEVRTLNGSLVDSGYLPPSQPATSNWTLNPATLEVRLIPDPNVPGQEGWPTHSQIIVLDANTHANVYYPFNPTNPQTIAGYAFWDRCAPLGIRANSNNCTENNVPNNNGLPVMLYNANGVEIASTLTDNGLSWNTGYFSFPNLPTGTYRARINLPPGYAPTTSVERWYNLTGVGALEIMEVGYQLNESQALGGRVFFDNDGNGIYDEAWDDPAPGIPLNVATPSGQAVANPVTSSNGGYMVLPINSGEYRVTLTHNGQTWTRNASIPVDGGVPMIDFAIPPNDSRPRVLVFIDGNHNGMVEAGEQRLANVTVRLLGTPCGSSGTELQMVNSNSGGLTTFNPVASGSTPVCAQAMDGLPDGLLPANLTGVNVSRNGGAPVALAVQPVNTLLVRAFLDNNSNYTRDSNEPFIGGGSVTVNGIQQTINSGGASFYLPTGVYSVAFVPPSGYASIWSLPLSVVVNNAAQTLTFPLRDAGSISGKVYPPNTGSFSLGGSSLASGLTVQLQNIATNATLEATSDSYGNFSFTNLTPATYRLRLPSPPPGYTANSEPLLTYQTGQILSNNNLNLVPVGHIISVVYLDNNNNQQWDNNEPGISDYTVRLVGSGGQQLAVATPDAAGFVRFEGLTANTPYALQLVNAPNNLFITTSPGVFTVGAEHTAVQLGVGVEGSAPGNGFQVAGDVKYQQGNTLIPIAGARVIRYAYQAANGGCNIANPVVLADTYTDINGSYLMQSAGACLKVVDVPGFVDTSRLLNSCTSSNQYSSCATINSVWTSMNYITLSSAQSPLSANANSVAQLIWSAFRDDNGNGSRDLGEPGLADVTLTGGGSSGVSSQTGLGQPLTLDDGVHTLTITPPTGFVVNGPETRTVSMQGVDVTLLTIPLRPAGLTIIQAFIDLDGDGVQDMGEAGVGGVGVNLNGTTTANAITTLNGRVMLAGLPDGSYTATVTLPAGYAAVPAFAITLSQGGAIHIPLGLPGMVSGVIYDDWDGDGQQQPDEPVFQMPFTLTLGTQQVKTMGGRGIFLGLPGGAYTLAATAGVVQPQSFSLAANAWQGVGLGAVASGVVRGTAWLDINGDGIRQMWEMPLAGVRVSLNHTISTVTDQEGRFIFYNTAPGSYTLNADLPSGLQVSLPTITVTEGQGKAVGLAVVIAPATEGFLIHLPFIGR